MPRVPRAQQVEPLRVTSLGSIGQASQTGEAIAGLVNQGRGIVEEFQARQVEARRKQAIVDGIAGAEEDAERRRKEAEENLDTGGAAESFRASVDADLQARIDAIDDNVVANAIRNRGVQINSANEISVSRDAHERFTQETKVKLRRNTDDAIRRFNAAPNELVADMVKQDHDAAVNSSDVLSPLEKDTLIRRFETQQATSSAIAALDADAQEFLETLQDGGFRGLTEVQRARFASSALDEIDRNARAKERQSVLDVKDREDDAFKEEFAKLLDPGIAYGPIDLESALPRLSTGDARVLRTIMLAGDVVKDDPSTLATITDAISGDDPQALEKLKEATENRQLTTGTFLSLHALIEDTQELDKSPMQSAIGVIKKGLGPTDRDDDAQTASKAIRVSRAIKLLGKLKDAGETITVDTGIDIVNRFRPFKAFDEITVLPRPFGFTGERDQITSETLRQSRRALAEALTEGTINEERAWIELNESILLLDGPVREREEARAASEARSGN